MREKFEQIGHCDRGRFRVDERMSAHRRRVLHFLVEDNANFSFVIVHHGKGRHAAGQHFERGCERLGRGKRQAPVGPDGCGQSLQIQRRRKKMHGDEIELTAFILGENVFNRKFPMADIMLREVLGREHGVMLHRAGGNAKVVEKPEKGAVVVHGPRGVG